MSEWKMPPAPEVIRIEFELDSSGRMIYAEANDRGISFVIGFKGSVMMGRGITYDEARELKNWIELQLFSRKLLL